MGRNEEYVGKMGRDEEYVGKIGIVRNRWALYIGRWLSGSKVTVYDRVIYELYKSTMLNK